MQVRPARLNLAARQSPGNRDRDDSRALAKVITPRKLSRNTSRLVSLPRGGNEMSVRQARAIDWLGRGLLAAGTVVTSGFASLSTALAEDAPADLAARVADLEAYMN